MTDLQYLQISRKCADINLQLIETILQLENSGKGKLSDELREMLEYSLQINWQTYRLTNEKLQQHDVL